MPENEFGPRRRRLRLPDVSPEFREQAVASRNELARGIYEGLSEGGVSADTIAKIASTMLAIAARGANRSGVRLPEDPHEGWAAIP